MKKQLFLTALCFCLRAGGADSMTVAAAKAASQHRIDWVFHCDISTNAPGYWEQQRDFKEHGWFWVTNQIHSATNYAYFCYNEQPFPRTNATSDHFEVYSNTYASCVLDGHTNQIAESHTKLGDLFRNSTTIISTETNTSATETFNAAEVK